MSLTLNNKNTFISFGPNFFYNQGSNLHELPHDENEDHLEKPNQITLSIPDEEEIEDLSLSSTHTNILTKSGTVYTCGTLNGVIYPNPTKIITELPIKCTQIACGKRHVLLLMEGGVVLSYGGGLFGQLGHGLDLTNLPQPKIIQRLLPQQLGDVVTSIHSGLYHNTCITQSKRSFGWGCNRKYQCGVASSISDMDSDDSSNNSSIIAEPLPIMTEVGFKDMALGYCHSLGLTQEGIVYIWGNVIDPYESYSDLGAVTPTKIKSLTTRKIVQIAAGDKHSLALADDGSVYSWGENKDGMLGHGHLMKVVSPRLIADFTNVRGSRHAGGDGIHVKQVFAAGNCSAALTDNGDLYTWGFGGQGQLGTKISQSKLQCYESCNTHQQNMRVKECYGFDSSYNILLPKNIDINNMALKINKLYFSCNCMILSCSEIGEDDLKKREESMVLVEQDGVLDEEVMEEDRQDKGTYDTFTSNNTVFNSILPLENTGIKKNELQQFDKEIVQEQIMEVITETTSFDSFTITDTHTVINDKFSDMNTTATTDSRINIFNRKKLDNEIVNNGIPTATKQLGFSLPRRSSFSTKSREQAGFTLSRRSSFTGLKGDKSSDNVQGLSKKNSFTRLTSSIKDKSTKVFERIRLRGTS